jgi:hypothetical protein
LGKGVERLRLRAVRKEKVENRMIGKVEEAGM